MLVPSVTVFFSSGCIVILELVAVRLVARDLGSSLYTWTSIIGVVLAGLSIGNYIGGRLADRFHARRVLAVLFGLASAACVAIVVLNHAAGRWLWLWRLNWPAHVVLHVSLVFLLPSALLGTIGPVVAKMALGRGLGAGRTVGTIHAWGAAGAIAGVFLAGFFLIPHHGSVMIVWLLGAALLAMAFLYWVSCWALHLWAIVFAALATMGMAPAEWAQNAGVSAGLREVRDPNLVLYESETPYHHIQVRRVSERPDRRAFWQDQFKHGEIVIGDVTNLQCFYTEIYAGLTQGLCELDDSLTVMVFGGRGYAFPQYLEVSWPASEIEVVEIDPGVTRAAMEAFGLDKDTAIRTVNTDAQSRVNQILRGPSPEGRAKRYDFIYGDAITDCTVPFQLVTKEFNDKVAQLLAENGVYMMSLIDTYKGGQFLGAVVSTLEESFPCVHVIGSRQGRSSLRETFVVVATRRAFDPEKLLRQYNEHLPFWVLDESEVAHLKEQAHHLVLTDDYAPTETLLTPAVRQGATKRLASRYLWEAQMLQRRGQRASSTAEYRKAMALNPLMSIRAYSAIGQMCIEQGDLEDAVEVFQGAIDYQIGSGLEQTAIAPVHMNLGILLCRMERSDEGQTHLAEAVKWFRIDLQQNPKSFVAWTWLGETLALMGDLREASDAFERAVALEPENVTSYRKWAKVLELQRRYDEAIAVLRRQIVLLRQQGQKDTARQVSQYIEILEYRRVKQQP